MKAFRTRCNLLRSALLIFLSLLAATLPAAETVTYYHTDALGSIVAATDEQGAVLWRESYRPYGERIEKTVATAEHRLFYTGKPHDEATGFTYFGARYYDPLVGRFIGMDPVEVDPSNPQSFSRYGYANNNPYRYIDLDGREADPTWNAIYPSNYNQQGDWIPDTPPSWYTKQVEENIASFIGLALSANPKGAVSEGLERIVRSVPKSTSKELTTFFPPNNGFLGSPTNTALQPGQIIDRFGGSEVSRFFSPAGTPAAMRALPPGTQAQPLRTFEVLKPIDVQSGQVAPAFNQIGLGTQFRSNQQLGELLEQGFLREVTK